MKEFVFGAAALSAGIALAAFDVRDFGAKGDGVTDDTAAFQAALSWLVWGVRDPDNRFRGALVWHRPGATGSSPWTGREISR